MEFECAHAALAATLVALVGVEASSEWRTPARRTPDVMHEASCISFDVPPRLLSKLAAGRAIGESAPDGGHHTRRSRG